MVMLVQFFDTGQAFYPRYASLGVTVVYLASISRCVHARRVVQAAPPSLTRDEKLP